MQFVFPPQALMEVESNSQPWRFEDENIPNPNSPIALKMPHASHSAVTQPLGDVSNDNMWLIDPILLTDAEKDALHLAQIGQQYTLPAPVQIAHHHDHHSGQFVALGQGYQLPNAGLEAHGPQTYFPALEAAKATLWQSPGARVHRARAPVLTPTPSPTPAAEASWPPTAPATLADLGLKHVPNAEVRDSTVGVKEGVFCAPKFTCLWAGCNESFDRKNHSTEANFQLTLRNHLDEHVKEGLKKRAGQRCTWDGIGQCPDKRSKLGDARAMRRHLKAHIQEWLSFCKCGKAFTRRDLVAKHIREQHGKVESLKMDFDGDEVEVEEAEEAEDRIWTRGNLKKVNLKGKANEGGRDGKRALRKVQTKEMN
ncbi:hypothetical protein DXG03_003389 [Asterophora parasitica]|uniref:C2H2-type domain-containing protein n=1 Tax=Asterophora parasitica TaxID=117018 RepID=A0A9P7G7L6_9AGAR|nr:hypothetical protein DXG03_003389 [Asterophora parasitica]